MSVIKRCSLYCAVVDFTANIFLGNAGGSSTDEGGSWGFESDFEDLWLR